MRLWGLSSVATLLAVGVLLALTNPTMDRYINFVEREFVNALEQTDPSHAKGTEGAIRMILRSHSHELLASVLRPHTTRKSWGVFSRFETLAFGTRIVVIGVGNQFLPLEGVDEAIVKLQRQLF